MLSLGVAEMNVLLITGPIIRGIYLDQRFPRKCCFENIWHTLVMAGFHTIAMKTTALSSKQAAQLLNKLDVKGKLKSRWVGTVQH